MSKLSEEVINSLSINLREKIKNETGASTATISRVRRCLNYGNDAYDEMLGRLYPEEKPFQLPKE